MKAILFATREEAQPFLDSYNRGRFQGLADGEHARDDRVLVAFTGVGKIKATLNTERLLRHFKPASVLHVGTCTALVEDVVIGSLFAVQQVFEGDRIELAAPTYPRMPLATPYEGLSGGTLVTQDHTVQDPNELTYWQRIAEASDMTGYAVAYVAATHGVPCTIVKVVTGRMGLDDAHLKRTLSAAHRRLGEFLVADLA